ncbi:toll/interleukin-1 receptor domain-containing protein [Culturomica sp.]|uniref:toll/interleukin-1 receptor domain-containing protein n=1 Tax=Culturomica sp. TaxID=1926652 RepID=UPI000E8C204F|nr:toll/interleukin-1 receptor domain-containing protein [Culturomica sp.]HBO26291.1 toll/interleukin-1 receptor domain-containing protein [Culturomica sp.]
MERDVLFISHATPEDNEFAIWLASRLEMLGYKTWIDKNGLLGGEHFWLTIQNVIRDNTIKVLWVYSKNICDKDGNLKDGIYKEISYAESVAKDKTIKDFIIPLHIDSEAPYNAFIGANRLNHIPFDYSWAEGLKQLLKKLERDDVPKTDSEQISSFSEWYENNYISKCKIISNKHELFYTSWWQVDEIPNEFYIYKFSNAAQADAIRKINPDTPISLLSNILSTFNKNLCFEIERENEKFQVLPENIYSYSLSNILDGFESENFPSHNDVQNHFKRLLFIIITAILRKRGLWKYEMSNKQPAYFLPIYEKIKPIKFVYPYSNKEKRKAVIGTMTGVGYWHYALSFRPILSPFLGFSLKSHLIFTTDGFNTINDDKKAHAYRRKKGKRFFNEEWRDLLLAMLQNLKDPEHEIKIKVSDTFFKMKEWPETF